MKNVEYSPLSDVNVPYIEYAGLSRRQRARLMWEVLTVTSLPAVTRWVIVRALKGSRTFTRR